MLAPVRSPSSRVSNRKSGPSTSSAAAATSSFMLLAGTSGVVALTLATARESATATRHAPAGNVVA